MQAFELEDVRRVARNHGYREIERDEVSRVIGFRGGNGGSNRINVYYTTGTVGTCLNHPTRGKTQLFRRNVAGVDELERIFENPRNHTGRGYYRKSASQQ